MLLLGSALYVVVDAMIMPSYTRHGVSVRVPDVENQPFERAKNDVERRGLTVKRQVGRYNPNVAQGTVVDQNPPSEAGVKPGRRVYLTVNAGTAPIVSIPDLNGISVREARNRVAALGLKVDSVRPDSIPSPYPNTVTRQMPEPGDSLKQGEGMDLWYSTGLGTDSVQVPSVVGRTAKSARRLLLRRQLRSVVVNATAAPSPEAKADTAQAPQYVRRQGRAPQTSVRAGTEIRLFTTLDSTQVPRPDTTSQDTSDLFD
jgi:beta-lactam-binding protein with PASTA domain